ncbi:MAG: endopeptidase La [Chloroflexota bacterium]|nr:endopeptidase La [Dehalococcoidia bacterium]MDW8252925.1 endopeptidase La [Chloroflexota bacterium]
MNAEPSGTPPLPDTLPLLPLRGAVVYPLAVTPLVVGQERSLKLIDSVMQGSRLMLVVGFPPDADDPKSLADLPSIGAVAVIHQLMRAPDGTIRLLVQGLERARILAEVAREPFFIARFEPAPDQAPPSIEAEALRRLVVDLFRQIMATVPNAPAELLAAIEGLSDPRQVAYFVASTIPLGFPDRQAILELDPVEAKLRRLNELLQRELQVREIGRQIAAATQSRMDRTQREYFLREQLRAIQQELGETEEGSEVAALRKQIEEAGMPEEVRREAERELNRLQNIPTASPEHAMTRTYLEWLVALPWAKTSGRAIDIDLARKILDEEHYDLEQIKSRILEYLAVRKLRQERHVAPPAEEEDRDERIMGDPVLCFVGPPGVGKTSLARSIAHALNRKLVQISLGGVRDEAEIRGHRRTYIGAMPGRIIQGIRRAEVKDPVFVLDEIDKVGADWRGDPAAALLEVLDPAQNHAFVDTYLGVPFDLSQVMFIATGNTLETIPPALRDRMEIITLAGYTEEEKLHIALEHLLPKQLRSHGLREDELRIEPGAVRRIIREYTREAGVRGLNREIGAIARKVARAIAEGKQEPVVVTADDVPRYLDRPRYYEETAERTDRPGVATGLAWTPVGGDVLFVEATMMPSGHHDQLILTGMLGDVMRESAQAALSYLRSDARRFGIDPSLFEGKTFHIHVPAGAIPKDGPSAGITMTVALASLLLGRPVRADVAMTGEITLRGKVLPVGGIKEKVLAAHRLGIRTVILPKRNERDTDDIPPDVRNAMTFVFVDEAAEAIAAALEPAPVPAANPVAQAT